MGSLFFIKAVKVRDMLEIVCVKLTTLYHLIRLYIVIKYGYLQIIALLLQNRLYLLQNF